MKTFRLANDLRASDSKYGRIRHDYTIGKYDMRNEPPAETFCKFCGDLGYPFCSEICKERWARIHEKV